MCVSQRLSMYITSLINIAFNSNEHENQDMLKLFNLKAYININMISMENHEILNHQFKAYK